MAELNAFKAGLARLCRLAEYATARRAVDGYSPGAGLRRSFRSHWTSL
jgi:hypothetical protein